MGNADCQLPAAKRELNDQPSLLPDQDKIRDDLTKRLDLLWSQNSATNQPAGSPVGQLVSHYRIRSFLGSGAFGVVYLADDVRNNQPVALKFPRAEILIDAAKRKCFGVEAALTARLTHPGIVPILESDLLGANPFIATQWCDGPDLGTWFADSIARDASLPPWTEVAETVAKISDAVHFAHQQNVIHRDLKPANILLKRLLDAELDDRSLSNFTPMITDFGLAKLVADNVADTHSSLAVGSPLYMAPEQIDSRFQTRPSLNSEKQVDIYSLGVILFKLLTGQSPIHGESHFELIDNIRHQPSVNLLKLQPGLPKGLAQICKICLNKNPVARYENSRELAEDLRRCIAGKSIRGKKLSTRDCFCYWCTRPQRIKTAGTFAIVLNLIVIFWMTLGIISIGAFDIVTPSKWSTIVSEGLLLTFLFHLPLVFLGWKTIQGKRWGPWLAWLLTASIIPTVILALLDEPLMFRDLYYNQQPYFSFMTHSMLLICFSIQLLLFSCSLVASFQKRNAEWRMF